jgi:hypothetical protein
MRETACPVKLMVIHRRGVLLVAPEVVRHQVVRFVAFAGRAVELARATLQDLVHRAGAGVAERRVGLDDLRPHFLHGIARRAVGQAAVPGGVGDAIE